MKVIGVTGKIGSGKSTICAKLAAKGFLYIDADSEAKKCYERHHPVFQKLLRRWGRDFLDVNGNADHKKVAKIIFSSRTEKSFLESLVYAQLRSDRYQIIRELYEAKSNKVIIYEAALLFESGIEKDFQKIALITCNPEIRYERLLKRGMNLADIRRREQFMMHDVNQRKKADWIYENDGPDSIDSIVDDLIMKIEGVENFLNVIERDLNQSQM